VVFVDEMSEVSMMHGHTKRIIVGHLGKKVKGCDGSCGS
jgi:hypothetical protein